MRRRLLPNGRRAVPQPVPSVARRLQFPSGRCQRVLLVQKQKLPTDQVLQVTLLVVLVLKQVHQVRGQSQNQK